MKRLKNTISFFIMSLLCGCASHYEFDKSQIVHDEALLERCITAVEKMKPSEATMTHRVILEVWGEEYDFNGCLGIENGKILKGASYGDMGGKVFEFSCAGDQEKITSKPDGIPEDALKEGMLGDMKFLYAKQKYRNFILVQQGVSHFDLVCCKNDEDMDVYMFRDLQTMPDMSLSVSDSEIIITAKYSDFQSDEKRGLCIPYKIELNNYSWHYKTAIRLLDIKFKD